MKKNSHKDKSLNRSLYNEKVTKFFWKRLLDPRENKIFRRYANTFREKTYKMQL